MSTNITTILNKVRAVIPTLLDSSYFELTNPYILEENNDNLLKKGWAMRVGASTSSAGTLSWHVETRSIGIVLTRMFVKMEGQQTILNTTIENILEDAVTLKLEFIKNEQLQIPGSILKVDFNSDSGINFVRGDRYNYLYTEVLFDITLKEVLSC